MGQVNYFQYYCYYFNGCLVNIENKKNFHNKLANELKKKIENSGKSINEKDKEKIDLTLKLLLAGIFIPKEKINRDNEDYYLCHDRKDGIFPYISKNFLSTIDFKSSKIILENLKSKSENDLIKMYEYPEIIEDNIKFSVVLMGDEYENKLFINGFLNFLFGVKYNDNYRLVHEEYEKNNETFCKEIYIKSDFENFKFFCIDINIGPSKENIDKIISILNANINLVVLNYFDTGVRAWQDMRIRIKNLERLDSFIQKLMKEKKKKKKNCLFFLENFPFFDKIKSNYINSKLNEEFNTKELTEEINKKIVKMINEDFSFNFINYNYFFKKDDKDNKLDEINNFAAGYFSFYKTLIKREKNFVDFSSLINFFFFFKDKIELLEKLKEEIKLDKEYYSQKKKNKTDENVLKKLKEAINKKIEIHTKMIELIDIQNLIINDEKIEYYDELLIDILYQFIKYHSFRGLSTWKI